MTMNTPVTKPVTTSAALNVLRIHSETVCFLISALPSMARS
jgi:hypothetical protein